MISVYFYYNLLVRSYVYYSSWLSFWQFIKQLGHYLLTDFLILGKQNDEDWFLFIIYGDLWLMYLDRLSSLVMLPLDESYVDPTRSFIGSSYF